MAKTILVTGGAGFIGSHVCDALLARGDSVLCLDNFDPYYPREIKEQNIAECRQSPHFTLNETDIRDREGLSRLGSHYEIDGIIHLAARAGVRPSIQNPTLYSDINLGGTTNLLEFARAQEISKFVFASSSSVYGERTTTPFHESDTVDHPVSPYAATKKAGELLCHCYHHLFGIDISCLRFFTVYGPRQRPEMAIHKFFRMIENGDPIPLYGDGSARRDFTFVADIVSGILAAYDKHSGYGVYNLGNHQMVSVAELIAKISNIAGKEAQIEVKPAQPGDVSCTCAEINHSQTTLGYQPATPLEIGLQSFFNWFQLHRSVLG